MKNSKYVWFPDPMAATTNIGELTKYVQSNAGKTNGKLFGVWSADE